MCAMSMWCMLLQMLTSVNQTTADASTFVRTLTVVTCASVGPATDWTKGANHAYVSCNVEIPVDSTCAIEMG